jgi:hypothetical protein
MMPRGLIKDAKRESKKSEEVRSEKVEVRSKKVKVKKRLGSM